MLDYKNSSGGGAGFSKRLFVNSFVSYKGITLTGTTAPGQSEPGSNDYKNLVQ